MKSKYSKTISALFFALSLAFFACNNGQNPSKNPTPIPPPTPP
ncbi:MAG: hypothetical protein ACTTKH_01215 [Treponema sp.]